MSKGIVSEVLPLALIGGAVYFGVKLLGGTLPSIEAAISGGLAAATPGATVTPGLPPSAAATTLSNPSTVASAISTSSVTVPSCAVMDYQGANQSDPPSYNALYNWAASAGRLRTLSGGGHQWACVP